MTRTTLFAYLLLASLLSALIAQEPECANCGCCLTNQCITNSNFCQTCKDGYSGDRCYNKCANTKCVRCAKRNRNNCVLCMDGYYGSNCNNLCRARCVSCTGKDTCLTCVDGRHGTNCVEYCRAECVSCTGWNACTACVDGRYGTYCDSYCRDECLACTGWDQCTACKEGYFSTSGGSTCDTCPSTCVSCTSSSTCTECKPSYYNTDTSNDCSLSCSTGCAQCTSATSCTACADDYFSDGFGSCAQCRRGCASCTSYNQCSSCKPGFTGALCGSCVADKHGADCDQDCPGNCITCTDNSNCQQCRSGYYNGLSPTGGDMANDCRYSCPDSCHTCSSYTSCTACWTSNYKGAACEICIDRRYGTTCTQSCPANCLNNVCDRVSGNCSECKTGYAGDKCDRCEVGKYGTSCSSLCSNGCKDDMCYRNGGACTDGCKNNNMHGTYCEICITGYYNTTCLTPCPANCDGDVCHKSDGRCFSCKIGYFGTFCDQCTAGKHGANCDKDCPTNCLGQECKREDGRCVSCKVGFYGDNCTESCSTNCNGGTCIQSNGTCLHGCVASYSGDRCCVNNNNCDICSSNENCLTCATGWHGEQCNQQCPENCTEAGCNKDTSECFSCKVQHYGSKCENECSLTCVPDGSTSRCHGSSGYCVGECEAGYHGDMCDKACSINCNNATCSKDAAACRYGCIQGYAGASCSEVPTNEGSPAALIGGVVAGVVVLAVIAVIVVLLLRRRRAAGHKYEDSSDKFLSSPSQLNRSENGRDETPAPVERPRKRVDPPEPDEGEEIGEDDVDVGDVNGVQYDDPEYGNIGTIRIAVVELEQYVASTPEQDLINEYKVLPRGLIKSYTAAKLPQNMVRNRYAQVYPYDENRVKLTGGSTDYINASYINGYGRDRAYIASLGPTKTAMVDFKIFWDMVWQKEVEKIVMLTNLVENTKMKCHQYWPEAHDTVTYGDVTVMNLFEDVSALYIVRNFSVAKGSKKRTVSQVHFTAWPDKGVPDHVTSIVELHNRVNRLNHELGGPILVHCSAGIGRTGTYIGLDLLTEEGEDTGHVDIYNGVKALREQRINMVQTEEQYVYLHKALVHSLTFDSHPIKTTEFQEITAKTSDGDFEVKFQRLKETMEKLTEEEERSKKRSKSFTKYNRNGTDIPGDRYRPRLFKFQALGDNDYINAVFIDSFKTKNHFLAAQSPLPGTVIDFIKLVLQENCTCVVNLEPETLKTKSLGDYLPPDNETVTHGQFTLSSTKLISPDAYTVKQVTVSQAKTSTETIVHCFQFNAWPGKENVPRDATTFLRFIKDVKDKARELVEGEDRPPILLHCLSGAIKCGLFCAVHNAVEKIDSEQEVSIVNIMRQIKVRRRTAFPNKDQLVFSYNAVCAYLDSFNTYSNFELRM